MSLSSDLASSTAFAPVPERSKAGYECSTACDMPSNSSTLSRSESGVRSVSSNNNALFDSRACFHKDIILGLDTTLLKLPNYRLKIVRREKKYSSIITYEGLKTGLARLGSKLSKNEVKQLMEATDVDGNGTIDYIKFITPTMHKHKLKRDDNLYSGFQYFDNDYSGDVASVSLVRQPSHPRHGVSRCLAITASLVSGVITSGSSAVRSNDGSSEVAAGAPQSEIQNFYLSRLDPGQLGFDPNPTRRSVLTPPRTAKGLGQLSHCFINVLYCLDQDSDKEKREARNRASGVVGRRQKNEINP
ncbi:hypothetical protein IEQ34_012621 [Dendrobium chrysotoxum]|uniref:Calmodulin n=1 Tax=Dendrobium chrysotoxum TaxID=161865 RepID=A0AAV7GL78_DENCH|nr:hypothetical protein IEQ34_012621 [Dendrobium chrysotoxum]